jgi:hypothetical protein
LPPATARPRRAARPDHASSTHQNHHASDEPGSFYLNYADADLDADSRDTGPPLCLQCLADDSDGQLAPGLGMARVQAGEKARGVAPSRNDEERDGHRPDEGEDGKRREQPAPSCRLGDRTAGHSSRFVHVW